MAPPKPLSRVGRAPGSSNSMFAEPGAEAAKAIPMLRRLESAEMMRDKVLRDIAALEEVVAAAPDRIAESKVASTSLQKFLDERQGTIISAFLHGLRPIDHAGMQEEINAFVASSAPLLTKTFCLKARGDLEAARATLSQADEAIAALEEGISKIEMPDLPPEAKAAAKEYEAGLNAASSLVDNAVRIDLDDEDDADDGFEDQGEVEPPPPLGASSIAGDRQG